MRRFWQIASILLVSTLSARGQFARGELRVDIRDPQGATLAATAELVSDGNQFRRVFQIGADGHSVLQELPFGIYKLSVSAPGFAPWNDLITIRSDVPVRISLTLAVAPVVSQVEVSDAATLVNPYQTGAAYTVGHRGIGEQIAPQPGRTLSDLANDQPGWLYEANGVLHPRGSEYDVLYVVDGLPLGENRSPAFAPALDAEDVESLRVLTANYPAEYGRKLGGVIEVTSSRDAPKGWHGKLEAEGGSFSSASGSAWLGYAKQKDRFSIAGNGFHTERYLDPPVLENFTNRANAGGFSASYERDFSERDRLRVTMSHSAVRFLVPDYLVQEQAGQRQDAANTGTGGQVYFQRVISSDLFWDIAGRVRDTGTELSSNAMAIPVIVSQDRGYREGYIRTDVAGHHGHHDWKAGMDSIFRPVHEALEYTITDPTQFDPGTQTQFQFSDRKWDIEPSAYLQDQIHAAGWNLSGGLRFDSYGFVIHESAWSPRIGVSRYVASLNLLLHASYDRAFQTPAVENLLLASSPQLNAVNPVVVRLPVRPGRGNFYEGGLTKAFFGKLRLDANVFRRDFRQYSDDDLLLNTGVGFPIAFSKARIVGEELRLEMPHWGRFSAFLSYANQSGIGRGPITGGLFLGSDAANRLAETSKFAVTQDQRNTARARVRFQAERRVWLALDGQYGSGLPADIGNTDPNLLLAQYGAAILGRVNLDRGRVRPNLSLNTAAGLDLYRKEQRSASFEIQATNLADRLNVINFASLFSGTAVGPPRSLSARMRWTF